MVIRYYALSGANHSPSAGFTWEDWDLTLSGVPGNCVAEIRVTYPRADASSALEARPGVREKGSSLSRRTTLSPYFGTAQQCVFRVNTDSDAVVQIYDNYLVTPSVPHCVFNVIGYYIGATYTETFIDLDFTDTTWDTNDLYTEGVPKNSVVDIMLGPGREGGVQTVGLREYGETGRTYLMKDTWYDYGQNTVSIYETTDETNGYIQTYCTDATYMSESNRVFGYWDQTVGHTVVSQVIVPSGAASWVDHDLDTYSVPTNVAGVFILYNREDDTVNTIGVRKDGSSLTRYVNMDKGEYVDPDYYATCGTMTCQITGTDSRVEVYTTDTTYGYLILDGYLKTRGQLAKIDNIALASIAKIDGIATSSIIAVNNIPLT